MTYINDHDTLRAAFDSDVSDTTPISLLPPGKRVTPLLYGDRESMFSGDAPPALAKGWSVFPQEIQGRRPGSVGGHTIKWSKEHDLANLLPSPEAMNSWVHACATLNTACVFGPASGHTFAVDVDIMDEAMSAEVCDMADDILGPTPFRREGRAPKMALIYRHGAEPENRVASSSRLFASTDPDSKNGLEILGAGKLITFFGRHHITGRYFTWLEANPMRDRPEKAPLVTPEMLKTFLAAVDARFPFARGGSGHALGDYAGIAVPTDAQGRATDGREALMTSLVWRIVREQEPALRSMGHIPVCADMMKRDLVQRVVAAFAENAALDGRWAPSQLAYEAGSRVDSLVAKMLDGRIEPAVSARTALAATVAEVSRVRALMHTEETDDVDAEEQDEEATSPAPATNLPVIIVEPGQIERIVDEAEAALIASGRGIYQRGGEIVGVGTTKLLTWDEQDVSTYRIVSKDEYSLGEDLAASAQWLRYDARAKKRVVIDVPVLATRTLRSRGKLDLPVLNGFLSAPTLRPDGSIVQKPGYDARTTLLLDLKQQFPRIPENPTKEDAAAALAMLRATVSTFPFASGLGDVDESVVLSAMLTAVIRRSLAFAPIHAFTAPTPGTGKSKLVDMVSALMCGTRAGVISQGRTEEEDEKRLSTAVMAATAHIAVDNATIPVGGAFLDQLMTQETVCPRILGQSKAPACSTNVLVTYNGNNLVVTQDSIRRTLLCTLDARCERPQDRAFSSDPVEDVMRDRARLVVAALTVLRAFHVAGRPDQGVVDLGSFVQWSRWVRNALLWLGMPDPVLTQKVQADADPAVETLAAFLTQWMQTAGVGSFLVRELIDHATRTKPQGYGAFGPPGLANPDFNETLMGIAGQGNGISGKRLAKWMASHAKRRYSGLHFVRDGERSGTSVWRLIQE